MKQLTLLIILPILLFSCSKDDGMEGRPDELKSIDLPEGFKIDYFTKEAPGAGGMYLTENNYLFVGSTEGKVFAFKDENSDGVSDKKFLIADGLDEPYGVTYLDGDLYVGEKSKILRYRNIIGNINNPISEVIFDGIPPNLIDSRNQIDFGPDGLLYFSVAAPCNACMIDSPYGRIYRMDKFGNNLEEIAQGVRSLNGMAWNPDNKDFWFTEASRNGLADQDPNDELNLLRKINTHFGFPYCHGNAYKDPYLGGTKDCNSYGGPNEFLAVHSNPYGFSFYQGWNFPLGYHDKVFIAEHGSMDGGNSGFRIMMVSFLTQTTTLGYNSFATGWKNAEKGIIGRPADLIFNKDGIMFVSDPYAGVIYKIWYDGKK